MAGNPLPYCPHWWRLLGPRRRRLYKLVTSWGPWYRHMCGPCRHTYRQDRRLALASVMGRHLRALPDPPDTPAA